MILEDGHVELEVGAIVDGRLRIVEDLARGSMSSVYLARETDTGRDVVLKVLGGKYATRADARPRLLAEQEYTAALADKPGIVRVLSTGALADEGDAPYLVLEFVDGPTLTGHVAGQSPDAAHVLELLAELAGILVDVHAAGIVHRDVKPENVLVAERAGEVVLKLTDFGLATRAARATDDDVRLTGAHDRPGTQHYMAPEQCVGGDVTTAADIYALGVSAFELLVGEPPWGSRTGREVVIRKCDPTLPGFAISDLSLGLPAPVVEVIDAALQREPSLRPTAAEFRVAMSAGLSELRARLGARSTPPVRVVRERTRTSKRSVAASTLATASQSVDATSVATHRIGRRRMQLVVAYDTPASSVALDTNMDAEPSRDVVPASAPARVLEAECDTCADAGTSTSAHAGVAQIEVPKRRGGLNHRVLWSAASLLLLGAAVWGLWWVNDTARTGTRHPEVEERRPAIARDEPLVEAPTREPAEPPARPIDASENAAPDSAPSPQPPRPASSLVPNAEATSMSLVGKPAVSPRVKPTTTDVPAAVPTPAVAAVPIHETPACAEARDRVARAASAAAWEDVLAHSKNRKCWSDASVVTRARVRALATLARYDECVREGKGVTDPALTALIEVCRTRRGNP